MSKLPKFYSHVRGGSTPPDSALYGNVNVMMPNERGATSLVSPALNGYKFGNALEYLSFLNNECNQILTEPEFQCPDISKPLVYDFLKYLKTCGGAVVDEYNQDATVKDPEKLAQGKVARAAIKIELLREIKEKLELALEDLQYIYSPESDLSGDDFKIAESDTIDQFLRVKDLCAQYIAIAQENEDLNAIETLAKDVNEIFRKKKPENDAKKYGKCYTEMQEIIGVSYIGANNILQALVNRAIESKYGNELSRDDYLDARNTLIAEIRIAKEKNQGRDKQQIYKAINILNDLAKIGTKYYNNSQGPEIDGAIRAQVGHCIFTDKREKIAVSNLEHSVALMIVNKREAKDSDGTVTAQKGSMCTAVMTADTVSQIPGIFDCFLANHPGIEYKDLGVYLVGGRNEFDATSKAIKNRSLDVTDDVALKAVAGDVAVVTKHLLDFLQYHPATIQGTALLNPSQALSFVVKPDDKGELNFELGRAKSPRKEHMGIDVLGSFNLNDGIGNIARAPWIEDGKDQPPYITKEKFLVAGKIANAAIDGLYTNQLMTPDTEARYAPIIHAYGDSFHAIFDGSLRKAYSVPAAATVVQLQRNHDFNKADGGQKCLAAINEGYNAGFGLFVDDPSPFHLNKPIEDAARSGLAYNRQTKTVLDGLVEKLNRASGETRKQAIHRTACGNPHQMLESLRAAQPAADVGVSM